MPARPKRKAKASSARNGKPSSKRKKAAKRPTRKKAKAGARSSKARSPAAKRVAPREELFDAAAEDQIKAVLAALARSRALDPSNADYKAPSDVVVIERDGGLIGGNPVGYFFRTWPELAAARWLARTDLEEVDLRAAYRSIMMGGDDEDEAADADEIAAVFAGQLAGEETVFEGTIEQLCVGDEGAELRAMWRLHLEIEGDLDDGDDAVAEGGDGAEPAAEAAARDRAPIEPDEREAFFEFLRSGGL